MKLLFVSHKHPWPLHEGTRLRLYHLLRALAVEHSTTLVTLLPDSEHEEGLSGFPLGNRLERMIFVNSSLESAPRPRRGSWWIRRLRRLREIALSPKPDLLRRWDCPELLQVLQNLRKTQRFDAVWVARSYIAEIVRRAGFENIVVDVDDIESISCARQLRLSSSSLAKLVRYADLAKLHSFERSLPSFYAKLIVCKEEDRSFFGQGSDRVFVVPNGVANFSATSPEKEQPGNVLFVGTMGYEPNIDAVRFFRCSILPELLRRYPTTHFHIVGKSTGLEIRELHDGVSCTVHGLAPDVTPHYERASLVIAPIRMGSGTRLKVLEALARGKAMVATTMAVEGLNVRPGIDLEIADTPIEFAATCARLLNDPAKRMCLANAGREWILTHYRWDVIGEIARRVIANNGSSHC